MASACAKTNEITAEKDDPSGNPAIEFRFDVQASRATAITTANLNRIGVFGYSTPAATGWKDADMGTYTPDYFLNKMVVNTASGWQYDGVTKYWPDENTTLLTFFAYAPFVDIHTIYSLYPAAQIQTGPPTITYTVPTDAIRQVDLVWNKQADLDRHSYNGEVEFTMDHALTSIAFEVQMPDDANHNDAPFTVEILDLEVRNVIGSGVFDLNAGSWTLGTIATDADLASYKLTPEEHKGLNDIVFHCQYDAAITPDYVDPFNGYVPLSKEYGTMMLLPQAFRDGTETVPDKPTEIVISYRITDLLTGQQEIRTDIIDLSAHAVASLNPWTQGKGITYQLTISLFDDIEIRIRVGAWIPENSGDGDMEIGNVTP